MKKWIGSVLVVSALVSGGYYAMGVATESALKKNIDILSQSNGVVVTLLQYHRGWFCSDAELKWSLKIPQPKANAAVNAKSIPDKLYTIEIPLKIYHGPFMFVDSQPRFGFGYAHADVALPPVYEEEFNAVYTTKSVKPLLHISAYVNYLNKTTIQLIAPAFKLIAKEGGSQFEWRGAQTQVDVSANKTHLTGHLMVKGFSWVKNGIKGMLGTVDSDYDLRRNVNNLYVGTAHLTLPSIALFEGNHKFARITGVALESRSEVINGLFDSSFSGTVRDAVLHEQAYGPSVLNVFMKNVDAKTLASINQTIQKYQQGTQRDSQRMLLSLLPKLPALFCKGAQFGISNLELSLPQGHLKAHFLLSLPNGPLNNLFLLVQKVTGEGHLRVSSAVVDTWLQRSIRNKLDATVKMQSTVPPSASLDMAQEVASKPEQLSASELDTKAMAKTADKVKALVTSGVLLIEGSDYVIAFKLANGKLMINGQPFMSSMLAI